MVKSNNNVDWRAKCKQQFDLKEVPESWKDRVPIGSQTAWRRYYKFRVDMTQTSSSTVQFCEANKERKECKKRLLTIKTWQTNFENLKKEIWSNSNEDDEKKKWHVQLFFQYDPIEGEIEPTIFSPYMIPRIIDLSHYFNSGTTDSQFRCAWGYRLVDFEEFDPNQDYREIHEEHSDMEYTIICSIQGEKPAGTIETSHLTIETILRLRRFFFGTIAESRVDYCNDYDFLRLLFGTMGTVDFKTLSVHDVGYNWSPKTKLYQQLKRKGVISKNDDKVPKITWLEYAMRKAAGALRPIDKYYEPPPQNDGK